MLKCRYIEPGKYTWNEHFTMPQLHQDLVPEVVEIFYTNKPFCRFYTCIQNQIIDKHVYVYHNPSTCMIVLIVSLQVAIVPYAAVPESWCHSMRLYIDVKLLPKSHCSLDSYFHGSAYPRKLVLTLQFQQQIWLEKFEENLPNLFASYKYSGLRKNIS